MVQSELEEETTPSPKQSKKTRPYPVRLLEKMLKDHPFEYPITRHQVIIGDSRRMQEIDDGSVQLIVTSPPYPMIEMWDDLFKRVNCTTFDAMHEYLADVWKECFRVLIDGGIVCINIGDALRKVKGKFQLFPNHTRVTQHCEEIGFTSLPYILWMKPTRRPNAFLGSGFIPPNAYVSLDCEFILIFRKGKPRVFPPKHLNRYASLYSMKERNIWFSQIWQLPGARQENEVLSRRVAAYPDEIAYRLIRMFSIIGDTVLDPFLGTATTMKMAMATHRNSIGYEINEKLVPIIETRLSRAKMTGIRKSDEERYPVKTFKILYQKTL